MERRAVSGIMLTLLLMGMLALTFNLPTVKAEPRTWTVDDDGPADFSTIQRAVYSASPGDTIYVKSGMYREPQVTINKPLQLIGENKNTTIVDGGGTWVCLYVQNTQNVTISGFTVQNGFGIYSWGSQNITINGNIIFDNEQGIVIGESTYITVSKNIVTQNVVMPILLDRSNNSRICENIFTLNSEDSIWLGDSSNNSIHGNKITSNGVGIRLDWSSNNRIYGNNITNNEVGIWYWASSNNSIYGNEIEDNVSGIVLKGYPGNLSSLNTIYGNNITNNGSNGIWLDMSSSNSISGNNITANNGHSIYISSSSNNNITENISTNNTWGVGVANATFNAFYDNYIADAMNSGVFLIGSYNNTLFGNKITNSLRGVQLQWSFNNTIQRNKITDNTQHGVIIQWNSHNNSLFENNIENHEYGVWFSESSNNKIYHNNLINNDLQVDSYASANVWDDGYPSGGNFWSDYEDMYPDAKELDNSGIWDTPYLIDDNNQDNFPLMEPWSSLPRTISELKTEIEELGSEDEIDNQGIVKSLMAKLNVAQKLVDKGKMDEVEMVLEGFIMQVQELSGIHITVEAADILIQSAEYILSHL